MPTKYIDLAFDTVVRHTPGAILFDMGEEDPVWIPKSMISDDLDEGTKVVPVAEWWAVKEGLI